MKKIKRKLKKIIEWAFFKYCYQESKLASYIICYFVPNTIVKTDGEPLSGTFLFAQLESQLNNTKMNPIVDIRMYPVEVKTGEPEVKSSNEN